LPEKSAKPPDVCRSVDVRDHPGSLAGKATSIQLFSLRTVPMRTFHMTWVAFFVAFFGWFGVAPLMPLIRDDLGLTRTQIGNTMIASVLITVLVRVMIGGLCDRFGPRLCYAWLLILGSFPVAGIGLAQSYESFLLFRLAIGAVGASFVITQYHTSVMFAPNCIGTANATTAGWGNLGGGVTQLVMPLLVAALGMLGLSPLVGWRVAMLVPGGVLLLTGVAYYFLTQDSPDGVARRDRTAKQSPDGAGALARVLRDPRVWALFLAYAACFGVELTINNVAALYFHDRFSLRVGAAGLIAGLFGLMNLFARTLGGWLSDRVARRQRLRGRVLFLFIVLALEGLALIVFSRMAWLPLAVATMIVFSLLVQMAEGATFAVVPFINKARLGVVAGIVGAGGNMGAVAAGFLFRMETLSIQDALLWLGGGVLLASFASLGVRFATEVEHAEQRSLEAALARAGGVAPQLRPAAASAELVTVTDA
jgi:MFS transporter, NNP family, nitrate/nitrite transporter